MTTAPPNATPEGGTPNDTEGAPAPQPPVPAWRPNEAADDAPGIVVHRQVVTGLHHPTGDPLTVHLTGLGSDAWESSVTLPEDGVALIEVTAKEAVTLRAEWRVPCVGATAYWTPDTNASRWLPPSWTAPRTVSLALGAPVAALVGTHDRALCTAAAGETAAPVRVGAGVVEESGEFAFTMEQELTPGGPPARLRIDLGGRHFATTLRAVTDWWAEGVDHPGVAPAARMPAYSTWYSLHQNVDAAVVEHQAVLAAGLGCESIIVDDGWQTADRTRGYGHCGDWEPNPEAFPDLAAHVAEVHRTGLAYLLWYALPFIGRHNDAWDRFKGMILREVPELDAAVLDPRHPEVRGYLIEKVSRAVEEWGMDGVKLDFIDLFARADPPPAPAGADHDTVHEGVRRLLADLDARLRRTRPDVIVEHRQPYVSPGLWPYATMVRTVDCPLSPAENRQRIVDCRLTAGPLAVHADMIMWNSAETPESVAVHLVNALFSVPQISVDLAAQTPDQLAALGFWLGVFRRHADVLQLGTLEPARPDLGYPQVRAGDDRTTIVARYAPLPVALPDRDATGGQGTLLVANADGDPVVLLTTERPERALARVQDCRGEILSETVLDLVAGVNPVTVPTGGLLTLTREH
ncbi:alpha-galactosidase [Streptomyces gardneri]|uniref:glycoside hydrolase family 36 protein n=1 Tax=Streptomyces gardneri TaxID=66892 RepID=UPI0006BE0841|nr:glycoside hydrolase family 36 protein [Streptomyces gardneri]QPK49699.1 alpha-galactosidase [Streptomyces gardneri]WRK41255.1 glycoside hydrolase family 36 protein [Streptomyces venezuelae]CUM36314.1 Alpha-galactosidase [Streptomyces venezuelae]